MEQCLYKMEEYAACIAATEMVIAKDPQHAKARFRRASALLARGDIQVSSFCDVACHTQTLLAPR